MTFMHKKAYLVLQNGQVFEGKSFGAAGEALGEAVFTTSMAGYNETLTDPSHYGQIVIQTFPLIGNYGVIPDDFESAGVALKGYVVREWCEKPSNFRSGGTVDAFLKQEGIPGIYDIDTRAVTRIIRESGVMNACIAEDDPREMIPQLKARMDVYSIEDAVERVTCKELQIYPAEKEKYRIVLMDFGIKRNIREELVRRGCSVTVVPAHTTARQILDMRPQGIVLSNGPGDPAKNSEIIKQIRALCESSTPIMGICLGHQLMALAYGGRTYKLKYGHRGGNQPVRNLADGRVFITTQNHGYAVENTLLDKNTADLNFVNVNDGTCEGIRYKRQKAFSVQFHPEAAAGPQDTGFLFDEFLNMI